ncbi:hypothetical protein VaNZ11_010714 [Volvox africanus]|uniref:RNA exonuclease 4 n=1 Tax=Volvox africanus TaxID=51714 RepID=A0ABQ5SAW9_9CHLO|nr:hypothetical protein VaNZ11_010714 [Volvox africanus]
MARVAQSLRGGRHGRGSCGRGNDHSGGRGGGGVSNGQPGGEQASAKTKAKAKINGAVKRPAPAAVPQPANEMSSNGKANGGGGTPAAKPMVAKRRRACSKANDIRSSKRRKVEAETAAGQRSEAGAEKRRVAKGRVEEEALTQNAPSAQEMAAALPTGDAATVANAAAAKPVTQQPVNSNWESLKCVVAAAKKPPPPDHVLKRRRAKAAAAAAGEGGGAGAATAAPGRRPGMVGNDTGLTKVLAIDCEMVGVGPKGSKSVLARVCIVNSSGAVLLDTFVYPKEKVTDYRTWVSGVRPSDLVAAPLYEDVIRQVGEMVKGRILVGHAIGHDLRALMLEDHPRSLLRDTSKYPSLMKELTGGRRVSASLKDLAQTHLGLNIQQGEHTPVDDARAALYLYQKFRREWEAAVKSGQVMPVVGGMRSSKQDSRSRDRRSGATTAGRHKARGGKGSSASSGGRHWKDRGTLQGVEDGGVRKKKRRGGSQNSKRRTDGQDKSKRSSKNRGSGAGGTKPLWSFERDPYADL